MAILLIVAGAILFMMYQNDLASSESTHDQLRALKQATETAGPREPETTDRTVQPTVSEDPEQKETTSQTTIPLDVSTGVVPGVAPDVTPDVVPGVSEETTAITDIFAGLRKSLPPSETNQLNEFFLENDDFIGWITIPDTRIDYPIVKASDNDYYLKHDFYGKPSKAGSIFMDYRNIGDGSDQHTIIYGHKIKNKTMFYDLLRFRDPEFYQAKRILTLETLRGPLHYKVFAAYTTGPDFYFISTRFNEVSHAQFVRQIRGRTDYEWDTDVDFSSKILTLATCSHDFKDSRYVVHAVLIEDTPDVAG